MTATLLAAPPLTATLHEIAAAAPAQETQVQPEPAGDEEPPLPESLPGGDEGSPDALRLGNQDFRAGRLGDALEVYRQGWLAGERDPILAYNLATTAHHLDRLPQAILWYRRASESLTGDRWLEENLELARARLEAPLLGPVGALGFLARHRTVVSILSVLLAWAALAAMLARQRSEPLFQRLAAGLAVAAALMYAFSVMAARIGPSPAVLLQPCTEGETRLPAGTETWVRRTPAVEKDAPHAWRIDTDAGPVICPQEAVARIRP